MQVTRVVHNSFVLTLRVIFLQNRRIVVRETNGVLREATWDERERMNFIYLPKEGQSFQLPPMLTDQNLPVCLYIKISIFVSFRITHSIVMYQNLITKCNRLSCWSLFQKSQLRDEFQDENKDKKG